MSEFVKWSDVFTIGTNLMYLIWAFALGYFIGKFRNQECEDEE